MNKEITRYRCMKFIRHHLPKDRKIHAAIIRLIITEKTFGEYTDPILPEFTYSPANEAFIKEIKPLVRSVDQLINQIKGVVKPALEKRKPEKGILKVHMPKKGNNFLFEYNFNSPKKKHFRIEIPGNVCEYLKHRVETGEDFKNVIFIYWLRYISLSNWDDTYQFRTTSDFHCFIKEEFKVELSLCASPLNANTELYGSLFYDIDRHFGSLGSYRDLIHDPNIAGMVEIFPPYIEEIMNDIVKSIMEEMKKENRELGYILFLPQWTDCNAYTDVISSPYLRMHFLPNRLKQGEERLFLFYSDQESRYHKCEKKNCLFILMNDKMYSQNLDLKKIFDKFTL